jgi:hypothetical protein
LPDLSNTPLGFPAACSIIPWSPPSASWVEGQMENTFTCDKRTGRMTLNGRVIAK